ncbi:putative ABC transport system substrate-binding protein [Marinobacterium sp. MBR-109]
MSRLRRTTPRLKHWLLCSLVLLLAPFKALAGESLVVLSDFSPSYNQVLSAIREHAVHPTRVLTLDQLKTGDSRAPVILAVGTRACERMLERYHPESKLICAFLPSATFDQLKRKLLPTGSYAAVSAIYIDQPLARQIRLARLVSPEAATLGTALGSNSLNMRDGLEQGAQAEAFELSLVELTRQDNPVQLLAPVVEGSDLFLVIPDSSVFNRAISKWLLYLSLRHKVPVIGFSASYTEAGAAASVHSSASQIGRQSAEWLNLLQDGGNLPNASFPRYFDVSVNPVAVRTLGIEPLSAELLQERLARIEAGG